MNEEIATTDQEKHEAHRQRRLKSQGGIDACFVLDFFKTLESNNVPRIAAGEMTILWMKAGLKAVR
jgi:hypothetical protein